MCRSACFLRTGFASEVPTVMSCSAVGKGRSGRACKLEDGQCTRFLKSFRGINTKSARKCPVSTLRSLRREIPRALELVIDKVNSGIRDLPSGNL